jgi:UDP-2,4-diacetamido-2,4,6-trideoxy-beta-L-altropyranose hydrolase
MKRFVFRADAGASVGFGHLSRCLALAEAVRRAGGKSLVLVREPSAAVERLASERGVALAPLAAEPGSREDAAKTLAVAADADVLVVDGYAFGPTYFDALRGPLVCRVDDIGDVHVTCDAILNHNLYGEEVPYDRGANQLLLVGPRYALVGDSFVEARERRPLDVANHATRLLVTFGGSDPTNETEKALAALDRARGPFEVRIVVGGANDRLDAIRAAARRARHPSQVSTNLRDLAPLMADSQLLLTAGGVSCSEACCIGVPAIAIAVAENQRRVVEAAGHLGLVHSLGWHEDVTEEVLAAALDSLAQDRKRRERMIASQRRTIDGRGKERAVQALLKAAASRDPA